jgi:hypothetical protein
VPTGWFKMRRGRMGLCSVAATSNPLSVGFPGLPCQGMANSRIGREMGWAGENSGALGRCRVPKLFDAQPRSYSQTRHKAHWAAEGS